MKSWQRLSYAALKFKFLFYCKELSRETGLQRSEHSFKNRGKIQNINHTLQTRQANKPLPRIVWWATKVQGFVIINLQDRTFGHLQWQILTQWHPRTLCASRLPLPLQTLAKSRAHREVRVTIQLTHRGKSTNHSKSHAAPSARAVITNVDILTLS